MTNFIVPIDFSVDSLNGLEWALLFSRKKTINIQMVYVITSSSGFHPGEGEQEHRYAENQFKKLIKEYGPRLGNHSKLRYIIKKGKVYREVVNQVNSYKNAVVSASTHGASGFEELFIGSNALKIIAASDKPVFTLRQSPVPEQVEKIVVPIKHHVDTRQKAPLAAELGELFDAELHVVAVSVTQNKRDLARLDSYARQVANYFKARNLKVISKTTVGDNLATLTCNYAEAVDADLITIMSSSLDKWNVFFGSYAQQMLSRSRIPLLNITPKEKHIPTGFSATGG
ncbi:MAG: universal stress protein [Bacteroidetes bacterium]|nr:MAG: universal stress protein [Bacteroidota bacterium]